jgi:hypothetical protein
MTCGLSQNSRQGINPKIPPCIGLEAWLSRDLRPGCGHAYDETPVGLVVYVRNDPVNYIDPDGQLREPIFIYIDIYIYIGTILDVKPTKAGGSRGGGGAGDGGSRNRQVSKECLGLFGEFLTHLKTNNISIPYLQPDGTSASVDLSKFDAGLAKAKVGGVTLQDDLWSYDVVPKKADAQTFPVLRYGDKGFPYYNYIVQFGAHDSYKSTTARFNGILVHELFHVGQFVSYGDKIPIPERPDAENQAEEFGDAYEEWAYQNNKKCDPFGPS